MQAMMAQEVESGTKGRTAVVRRATFSATSRRRLPPSKAPGCRSVRSTTASSKRFLKLPDYIDHILQCKGVSPRGKRRIRRGARGREILTSFSSSHTIRRMARTDVRKAIIPAAGLGTRFLPATKASPKEMLPLVDKPLIQYVVEEAVASGIEDIIVITGRGKRAIEDHFDRSLELEENLKGSGKAQVLNQIRHISNLANFCYVRQSEALGLGHAVLCAQHLIGDEPFAVILGDEIIDAPVPGLAQLIHIYKKRKGAVLGVQEVPHQEVSRYGIVSARRMGTGLHRVSDLVEKPAPADAPSNLAVIGRYVLPPEIFPILRKTPGKKRRDPADRRAPTARAAGPDVRA
ncbi:MAG: UTP--glucose-1-phosphate uridylyltransferase [Nitrospiraceae bacterium]